MPKIQLQLKVENPCQEEWEAMPVQGDGRFCAVCNKCVVDFTSKTDRELMEIFGKSNHELCGNFRDDQLYRRIMMPQPSRFASWQALLVAFGTLLSGHAAFGQNLKPKITNYASGSLVAPTGKFYLIEGTVYNRAGNRTSGVTIRQKGKQSVLAVSDQEGNFAFKVFADKLQPSHLDLVFSRIGYLPTEKKVSLVESTTVEVVLEQMLPLEPMTCDLDVNPVEKEEPTLRIRGTRGVTGTIYYVNGIQQLQKQKPPEESTFKFKHKL